MNILKSDRQTTDPCCFFLCLLREKFEIRKILLITCLVALSGLSFGDSTERKTYESEDTQIITLLFTNDLESTYYPVEAFWREDLDYIGGIAELATLIESIRQSQPNVFLFDAGDIFTGVLAKLTKGEISFELMNTIGYDAMTIGNHEFEFGWKELARQKSRVSFPVLNANLFYKNTDIPFAQPYCIIERYGIRIGLLGILGTDAATALNPPNIAGLDVHDPKDVVKDLVAKLRPDVDLIILLTHQGKTAPMQTDDEAHPDIHRGIDAEIELAGVIEGIDIIFSGHADAGTEKPFVHPQTGTLIMQTYGQGFHLGYLQLSIDKKTKRIIDHNGYLIPVDSASLAPHKGVVEKLEKYKARHKHLDEVIGKTSARLNRAYNRESDLGNLFADLHREEGKAEVGLYPSGGIRRDIDAGDVTFEELINAWPFLDTVQTVRMSGALLIEVLEQGLSLDRGIMQVSGMKVTYDIKRPIGSRVLEVTVGDSPLVSDRSYTVATGSFIVNGGDNYTQFKLSEKVSVGRSFSEVLLDHFRNSHVVSTPTGGRLLPQ